MAEIVLVAAADWVTGPMLDLGTEVAVAAAAAGALPVAGVVAVAGALAVDVAAAAAGPNCSEGARLRSGGEAVAGLAVGIVFVGSTAVAGVVAVVVADAAVQFGIISLGGHPYHCKYQVKFFGDS